MAAAAAPPPPVLGRQGQYAQLEALLALPRGPPCIFVYGAPATGKSHVLQQLCARRYDAPCPLAWRAGGLGCPHVSARPSAAAGRSVFVNCSETFTMRLLLERVLNLLGGVQPCPYGPARARWARFFFFADGRPASLSSPHALTRTGPTGSAPLRAARCSPSGAGWSRRCGRGGARGCGGPWARPAVHGRPQCLRADTGRCVLVLDNAEKLPRLHANMLQIFARLPELVPASWWDRRRPHALTRPRRPDANEPDGRARQQPRVGEAPQRRRWHRAPPCALSGVLEGRGTRKAATRAHQQLTCAGAGGRLPPS